MKEKMQRYWRTSCMENRLNRLHHDGQTKINPLKPFYKVMKTTKSNDKDKKVTFFIFCLMAMMGATSAQAQKVTLPGQTKPCKK